MKKLTAYAWAFIIALFVFVTAGLCTLGSAVGYGDSLTVIKNQAVYYELSSSQNLAAVYVNVGAVHTEVGAETTIAIKTSTSSTSPAKASWTALTETKNIGNLSGKAGTQYNWVALIEGQSRNIRKLSFTSTANLQLNEIVCLDTDGNVMEFTAGSSSVYAKADVETTLDAQDGFTRFIEDGKVTLKNNAYNNFAQEEAYYMSAVQNLLSGNAKYEDAVYTIGANYNYLAPILMAPSVAIFGNNVFALRLPAFIATCGLMVFAFLLIRELTKKDEYAFYFSLILAFGGLMTTVGRLGAPYSMLACALMGSLYFMYRFFAKGISSKDILQGGMNILISGLFGAVALAMDITAAIPVAGILVLFGFGLRRQKLAYEVAVSKAEETEVKKVRRDHEAKMRISYGFAAVSFGMTTIILLLLASVLAYSACVRAYGDVTFLSILWKGIKASAHDSGLMLYSATNASNVFAWWLPLKPAALFTGVANVAEGKYVAWHVLPNIVATVGALVAFFGVAVKVILDIVAKKNTKEALRLRRGAIVLFSGMVAAMLAGWAHGNVSALTGLLFQVCYLGFLPLAATLLPAADTKAKNTWYTVLKCGIVTLVLAVFVLSLPAMYGFTATTAWAKAFGWISILSNGFFRV